MTLNGVIVHLLLVTMLSAFEQIKEDYDYEDAKEIVNNGCQSGVCFKHIYYADSVRFFNKYPDEITGFLVNEYGTEFLANIFTANNAVLDHYIQDVVWCFIELTCSQIVNEYESTTLEELSNDSYNPERSMTDTRYALA